MAWRFSLASGLISLGLFSAPTISAADFHAIYVIDVGSKSDDLNEDFTAAALTEMREVDKLFRVYLPREIAYRPRYLWGKMVSVPTIRQEMRDLVTQLKSDDRLLFYFRGHGHCDEERLTFDIKGDELPRSEILDYLREGTPGKGKFVITDVSALPRGFSPVAPRSGRNFAMPIIREAANAAQFRALFLETEGVVDINSVSGDQESWNYDGRSIFIQGLLEALRTKPDSREPFTWKRYREQVNASMHRQFDLLLTKDFNIPSDARRPDVWLWSEGVPMPHAISVVAPPKKAAPDLSDLAEFDKQHPEIGRRFNRLLEVRDYLQRVEQHAARTGLSADRYPKYSELKKEEARLVESATVQDSFYGVMMALHKLEQRLSGLENSSRKGAK